MSKLTHKKVVENLLKAHLDSLEYVVTTTKSKSDIGVITESAAIAKYLADYTKFSDYTKLGMYTGRLADILKKLP